MPRNPVTYFKANMMQNLNGSLNDSQNSVVYPIDQQRKIEEVYKRLQAPINNINVNYNTLLPDKSTTILGRLNSKLNEANEAVSNLKKLNSSIDKSKDLDKVMELGDKELKVLGDSINETAKQGIEVNNQIYKKTAFKQVENKPSQIEDSQILNKMKNLNSKLKDLESEQTSFLKEKVSPEVPKKIKEESKDSESKSLDVSLIQRNDELAKPKIDQQSEISQQDLEKSIRANSEALKMRIGLRRNLQAEELNKVAYQNQLAEPPSTRQMKFKESNAPEEIDGPIDLE